MSAHRLFRRVNRALAPIEPHIVVGLCIVGAFVMGLLFSWAPFAGCIGTIVLIAVGLVVVEDIV